MADAQKSICILMPYFGKWPVWATLFFRGCRFNSSIHWLFFTDCPVPADAPANVKFFPMSFDELRRNIALKTGVEKLASAPYKLCDFRHAYGEIFEGYIAGYDYFGYGDMDVLYGDLRKFLTDDVLRYDIVSFHDFGTSGFLCLFRNTPEIRSAYRKLPNWAELAAQPEYARADEEGIMELIPKERLYLREYFCSPFPLIRWKDGTYTPPREWYWTEGSVRNSFDDEEYLCFHFFSWKNRWHHWRKSKPLIHCDSALVSGVRVNDFGFHGMESRAELTSFRSKIYDAWHRLSSIGGSYRFESGRLKKGSQEVTLRGIFADICKHVRSFLK